MKRFPPISRNGFTLIELLAVIAIIAILASFLMPGLSRAMKTAKSGQCKANLKQLMAGFEAYGADNKGYWPPAHAYDQETQKYGGPWNRHVNGNNMPIAPGKFGVVGLFQYLYGDTKNAGAKNDGLWPAGITGFGHIFGTPFACPGAKAALSHYEFENPGWGGRYAYGMNNWLASPAEFPPAAEDEGKYDPRAKPKKMDLVQSPSQALTLADAIGNVIGRGAGKPDKSCYKARKRHANKVNLAFVDGHVEALAPQQMPVAGDEGNSDKYDFDAFWRGFTRFNN